MISVSGLSYTLPDKRDILKGMDFHLKPGRFLAVLGENGAGKTTLLDILMGFRLRSSGAMSVMGEDPHSDPYQTRARIAYLSEKVDAPGQWKAARYLCFHRAFYDNYDTDTEGRLMELFRIDYSDRVGKLSTGEQRRLQIVGALSTRPELIIADEITAVLDILARRRFLDILKELQRDRGVTVVLATNVPEGLDSYADTVLLIESGAQSVFSPTREYIGRHGDIAEATVRRLDKA